MKSLTEMMEQLQSGSTLTLVGSLSSDILRRLPGQPMVIGVHSMVCTTLVGSCLIQTEHLSLWTIMTTREDMAGVETSSITSLEIHMYKWAVSWMMAFDYGFTRVISSYAFDDDTDAGPPHNGDYR